MRLRPILGATVALVCLGTAPAVSQEEALRRPGEWIDLPFRQDLGLGKDLSGGDPVPIAATSLQAVHTSGRESLLMTDQSVLSRGRSLALASSDPARGQAAPRAAALIAPRRSEEAPRRAAERRARELRPTRLAAAPRAPKEAHDEDPRTPRHRPRDAVPHHDGMARSSLDRLRPRPSPRVTESACRVDGGLR